MSLAPFVLSIDWDFFVGDSSESYPCIICPWSCKGAKGYRPKTREENDLDPPSLPWYKGVLKSPVLSQFETSLWHGVRLVVADCHASLYRLLRQGSYIYNIDHHPDWDTDEFEVDDHLLTCANWGLRAERKKACYYEWCYKRTLEYYSRTKAMRAMRGPDSHVMVQCSRRYTRPDLIFVCLSSPYTNPRYDWWFYKALVDLFNVTKTQPEFLGLGKEKLKKRYAAYLNGTLKKEQP